MVEERIGTDHKSASPPFRQDYEGLIDLLCTAGGQDLNLKPECACCPLQFGRLTLCFGTLRVHEQSDHRCFRDQFVQKPQGLRAQVGDEKAAPCEVAVRSAHARNESRFDRIASARENNWNGGGRRL